MISMSKPLSYSQAESYLQKENYYQQNSEKGYFYGNEKLLNELGIDLGQEVDTTTYLHLLQGVNPDNGESLANNSEKEDRRVGIDVTTSAPKSVSILEEFYRANGNIKMADKIRNAHFEANLKAMESLSKYARTRVYIDGTRTQVQANIIYATFTHDTSRENKINGTMDMQLHNHNMIFNLAEHNGKIYSLSNEEIYRQKMFLGQSYRSELAKNMRELGYEIETTNYKEGFWEVKGFDRESHIETFSGRSKDIIDKIDEYKKKYPHLEESELKEIIAQNEKIAKKSNIDRSELLKENLARMEEVGINQDFVKNLENKIDSSKLLLEEERENILQSHISQSILTLQENESIFTKESILKESLKYGIESGFTSEDYLKVIDNNENIVKFENNNELDSIRYSSLEILKAENYSYENINIKNYAISDKFDFDKNNIQEFINNSKFANMTDGQKEMFANILTTNNQFTIVQGRAGTGKTFSMEALNDFLEDKDIEVIGMSFTGKASEGLEKDSGIKSTTIHKFLIDEKKEINENTKERLIVVDEAGMCGSLQIEELMRIAEKNNDKIVFVGDSKQFNAVNQGKQFTELQNKSDNVVYLDQVMRQETEYTKEIVKSIAEKDIESTFKILEQKNLLIESSKEEQVKKIAEKFSSAENKQDILIIASKNEDRKALNSEIRRNLEFDESTKNTLAVKESVDFKGIVKKFNNHYENGMIVTVNKKGIEGFKQGDICEVVGKKDKNILILKNQFGKEKELNLKENHENISIFKETKKEFAKDEWIVFNKNIENKKTGFRVKNGERAIIESIDEKGNIKLNNGKSFNSNEVPYFDYGYAITDIKSQGMTAKETIVMADSNMANLNSFYVQATRTKREIEIHTDNIENLTQRTKNEQNKTTTINQKLTLDSQEKYERYVGNTPLKENQDMQKYQDYKTIIKKEIENAKSIEKKVNSSQRGQNRLSIANNSELARRLFAKDRNNMRVLSDGKMDCINQRSKMLLSNDVHNELEQGNGRKSDDKMRTTNESNSRIERELKEKKKERGREREC